MSFGSHLDQFKILLVVYYSVETYLFYLIYIATFTQCDDLILPEEKTKNSISRLWNWVKGGKKSWEQRHHINEKLFLHYYDMFRNFQCPNERKMYLLDDFVRGFFKSETMHEYKRKRWEKISEQSSVIKVSLFKLYNLVY